MADSALPRPPAYHQPVFIPPPPPRRSRRSCCFRCFCCCCCFLLIVILLLVGAITAFTLWLSPSLPSIQLNHLNVPSNNGTISLSLSVKNPNVHQIRFAYSAMNVRVTSEDGELVALGTVPGFSQGIRNTTGLKVNAKVVDLKEMKKKKVVNVWVDCSMGVLFQGVKSDEYGVTWFCDQVDVPTHLDAADGRQCVLLFNFAKNGWPVK